MILLGRGVGLVRAPRGGLGILATARRGPCCASVGNGLRAARATSGTAVSLGSGEPVRQSKIPSAFVTLSDTTEYESSGKLLR